MENEQNKVITTEEQKDKITDPEDETEDKEDKTEKQDND